MFLCPTISDWIFDLHCVDDGLSHMSGTEMRLFGCSEGKETYAYYMEEILSLPRRRHAAANPFDPTCQALGRAVAGASKNFLTVIVSGLRIVSLYIPNPLKESSRVNSKGP